MSAQPYYTDHAVTLWHGDCLKHPQWWHPQWWTGAQQGVMVSDVPYGMSFRSGMGGAFGTSRIAGDDTTDVRDEALRLWGDRPALIFGRWSVPRPPGTRMVLTWEKGNHVGMGDLSLPWKPNTEEIYVLGSGFVGHRSSAVLRHLAVAGTVGRADHGTRVHPTEKPLSLMRELVAKCPPEAIIVDPFAGSGSTLRAAKDLGRHAIGVEVVERYCEIAARRLSQGVLDLGGGAA